MSIKTNKKDFNSIIDDILNNDEFRSLDEDIHHGTTKYLHCMRVAYVTYHISKILGLNYTEATRGALLHDFFLGEREATGDNSYLNHPVTSVKNAKKHFKISKHEEDIIRTHMFHHIFIKKILRFINPKEKAKVFASRPKSMEGWIVCGTDMFVSLYEWLRFKAGFRIAYSLNTLLLFSFFFMTTAK